MSHLIVPTGQVVREVPMAWMKLLSNFAETWGKADGASWGVHCSKCGRDVTAGNGMSDRVLTAKCGCSEYFAKRDAL